MLQSFFDPSWIAAAISTDSRPDMTFSPRIETARTLGRIPLDLALVDLPAHDEPDPVSDNYVLCLGLRGTVTAHYDFGDGWESAVVAPGAFMPITPPRLASRLRMDAPHRHLVVTLPAAAVADIGGRQQDFGALHATPFRDSLVAELCKNLWSEAKSGNMMGDLYVDCARAALVQALRRCANQRPRQRVTTEAFCAATWKRIEAEIDHRLGEHLTVAMLAASAGMSETRFLRAFKARTGSTPYRYVLAKRIETAKSLMAHRNLGLAEIALATGFADQAHMTCAFARVLGQTPGEIRRALH
jgi:AraC-like DNA-binding protein